MRLFHYAMLPYLPDLQFRGQLREVVAIMRAWRDTGKTNHLLINKVMEYPKSDLWLYFIKYDREYKRRYDEIIKNETYFEFANFIDESWDLRCPFPNWHNKEYLRVCMANLYEKHFFGVGKSRITDAEWETLCRGYKEITGEEYAI